MSERRKITAADSRKTLGRAKPGVMMPAPNTLAGMPEGYSVFPDMTGFSPRNLKYMRKFAKSWPDRAMVQRTVAPLPWISNLMHSGKLGIDHRLGHFWPHSMENVFPFSSCSSSSEPSAPSPYRSTKPCFTMYLEDIIQA